MSNLPVLLVLLSSLLVVVCIDRNVLQLTDLNFSKHLKQHHHLLVMFFIPWSSTCLKVRPHFARAAVRLQQLRLPVALGKMDCSGLGRRTCERAPLGHHFPVFHLYHDGAFLKEYTGSRDAFGFVKFMRVQVLPAVIEIKSADEFKRFLKSKEDVVIVGFFEEESKLKRRFFRVAEEMKEGMIFAYTSCERVLLKEGVTNGIVLFRPERRHTRYEEDRVLYTGSDMIGEIKNFITNNYHGVVGQRNPANIRHFPNPLIVLYYTVDYYGEGKEPVYWRTRMLAVAHKYRSFVKFAVSAKDDFEEELADYDVDYASLMRPFVLARDLENNIYVMADEFSSESFDGFVDDFLNSRLTPYVKSERTTKSNEGAVTVVTVDAFEAVVLNSTSDVLLELYVPWSERAKKLAPVLRELADLLQDEDVKIVKMDVKNGELPKMFAEEKGPDLFWLAKDKKEPVRYEGHHTVHELMRFVARRATEQLRRYDRHGNRGVVKKDEL